MISATEARSGKSHRDENFPVASRLIRAKHRGPILAFYRFVRAADDISDHPNLAPDEKLKMLDALEAALTGKGPADPEAEPLRHTLAERGLTPRHALDLLDAFRLDARKVRYADWSELMAYCALSAMPVGRYVLDVHGEDRDTTWPASDAICAALQVINHLQDCGKDFRALDRVYLPLDTLAAHGSEVGDLAAAKASTGLKAAIAELAARSAGLLEDGKALPDLVSDTRLAMEIAAIHRLAATIAAGLLSRDPLSQKVHLSKAGFARVAFTAAAVTLFCRPFRNLSSPPWGEAESARSAEPGEGSALAAGSVPSPARVPRVGLSPKGRGGAPSPSGLTRGPRRADAVALDSRVSLRSPEDDVIDGRSR